MTKKDVSKAISTAARVWGTAQVPRRAAVVAVGMSLVIALVASGQSDAAVVSLCLLGFVAGGVRTRVGAAGADGEAAVSLGCAVTFAGALACGPLGAAAPAAMVVLGRTFVTAGEREPGLEWLYQTARAELRAVAAAIVFSLTGGAMHAPWLAGSLGAAAVSAVAFILLADPKRRRSSLTSLGTWSALAGGYVLAAGVRGLPAWVVLVPAVPTALAMLRLLRQRGHSIEEIEEDDGQETAQPSFIDPVTGAANGRYFEMFMQQEVSRSERGGHPISLLLIDVDNFGGLNSGNTKEDCDKFLGALAHSFKGTVREYDVIARMKDDEFVIVLPEADTALGVEIANRIHASFSGKILPLQATFSVGVATYPLHGSTVDALIDSAHHALNRAKFSGKNRVRSCHELAKAS